MKLNKIFPNFDSFNNKVLTNLKSLFPNSEWLDESNSFMSFQTLFGMLDLYYGDYDIRYDSEGTFIRKFIFDLSDLLPDIYSKQQAFIKNQLGQYLSEARNRAIKIEGGSQSNRDQNSGTKSGTSTTPVNMVVTEATDIANIPLSSANVQNLKFIENYNQSNEQTNFRFIDDLIKQLNSDYSLRLKEFMNMLNKHFRFIVSSKERDVTSLYDGVRFRNGYYVPDVDYLGIENREQITLTNGKVQTNRNDIDSIKYKIENIASDKDIKDIKDQLSIIQVEQNQQNEKINSNAIEIDSNKSIIDDLLERQTEQNDQINANIKQIEETSSLLNNTIESLKELKPFRYLGEYEKGRIYNINDAVSLGDSLYLSNQDDNSSQPPSSKWVTLESGTTIDLSNYYNKQEIDSKITEQNAKIDSSKTDIENIFKILNSNSTNIVDLSKRISKIEEYSKTGIIQVVIWNQNNYRIRLIPILTPPHLVGRENEFLDKIHISTTTTQYSPNNRYGYQEWMGGEYVEISNPQMNTDIEVRALNTNNFRDNNITMNFYLWIDMNQNIITTLNGDWSPKIIVPITSRYDRNGQTIYFVFKSVI